MVSVRSRSPITMIPSELGGGGASVVVSAFESEVASTEVLTGTAGREGLEIGARAIGSGVVEGVDGKEATGVALPVDVSGVVREREK